MLRPGEQQLTPNHPLAGREEHFDVQRHHKIGNFLLGFPSIRVSWLPGACLVAASVWRMLLQLLATRWHPAARLKEGIRAGLPCSSPWRAQSFS